MAELDLDAIKSRARAVSYAPALGPLAYVVAADVPVLVAEVRRLRAEVERARAEEREACAAICEKLATPRAGVITSTTAAELAQRIRARGSR